MYGLADDISLPGALVPVLVILPNLVWMFYDKDSEKPLEQAPALLTIIENIGRMLVFVLPFFLSLHISNPFSGIVITLMGVFLAIYYVGWIKYFTSGADARLLYTPMFGIPQPMAIMPALYFIFSAYLMDSLLMLVSSVIFGVTHVWVSEMNRSA